MFLIKYNVNINTKIKAGADQSTHADINMEILSVVVLIQYEYITYIITIHIYLNSVTYISYSTNNVHKTHRK